MIKRELKIGMFLAVALLILALFIFIVGDLGVVFKDKGYPLYVYFDSVAGLEKRTSVRMAGVKVGYVRDIRLEGGRARVLVNIDFGMKISRDSRATLASLGLLGEKYIEILPGKEPVFCEPGEIIEGLPPISFDQMGSLLLSIGNEVKEMGQILRGLIGEEESRANFRDILQNLSVFSADLKEFFGTNKEDLSQSVQMSSQAIQKFDQRVEGVAQNLDELIFLLKDTVEENRENIKINLQRIKELVSETEKSLKLLNESLDKINKGEGTLGKLIRQPELYQRAEEAVAELEGVIHPGSRLRLSLGLRADYYGESNLLKSTLSLGFWPTQKQFFLAQIIKDPWLDKFTYSAQVGMRWGALSPRVGIIESEFGAGFDYYVVKDRLRFSLESYDFSRDPRPRFRFWTRFAPSKYFYFLIGIDDFTLAPKREVFFGFGLSLS